jgi:hypothetical protein
MVGRVSAKKFGVNERLKFSSREGAVNDRMWVLAAARLPGR